MKKRLVCIWMIAAFFPSAMMAQGTANSTSTKQKQLTTTTVDSLPEIMKKYMVLKLRPEGDGYKLDTVSFLHERYFGVLDYLNDPQTPERYISMDPDY